MTIEKRGSSYRIKQMYQGQYYYVTVDHKPTQKEATILLAEKMAQNTPKTAQKGSVESYADKYIAKKEKEGKSPSTIKGYDKIKRNTVSWFLNINLFDVTEDDLQKLVKDYQEEHSPKSTRLMYGFYHAILAEYRPQFTCAVKLPSMEKKIEYEPTTKDIQAIVKYSEGTRYHIIMQLAMLGLRRGEAMCITSKDIDSDNVLTIDKDLVVDKDNHEIVKDHPKTSASYRRIPIPAELADEIREAGQAYTGSTAALGKFLQKAQDELGIPRFRLHMFRHFSAAHLHQHFTDEQVMSWMGWDEPSTMAKVYRYNLDPDKNMATMKESFSNILG